MALVLRWNFDNVDGSGNVTDLSGNGNNGTATAASFTAGPSGRGRALVCNGTSTFMYLATSPVQNYPFTVSCWVVRTGTSVVLWSMLDGGGGSWDGWYADGTNSSAAVVVSNVFNGVSGPALSTTVGSFDHLVYVARDITHRDLYLNGTFKGTDTVSANPTAAAAGSFQFNIGGDKRNGSPENYFTGNVADVRIYNGALGSDEILALYRNTPLWPDDVNLYARTGTYSEQIDTNFAEFQPEVGPPKRRRRMSISSETISFSTWMRGAEYQSFLIFYRLTLADGTLPFRRPRPRTGAVETFVFTGQAPSVKDVGFNLYEVQMTMKSVP